MFLVFKQRFNYKYNSFIQIYNNWSVHAQKTCLGWLQANDAHSHCLCQYKAKHYYYSQSCHMTFLQTFKQYIQCSTAKIVFLYLKTLLVYLFICITIIDHLILLTQEFKHQTLKSLQKFTLKHKNKTNSTTSFHCCVTMLVMIFVKNVLFLLEKKSIGSIH